MILRALTVSNLRRFAGHQARLGPFGDGITVISAPNEAGKSTFFDALHALFFQPHGSAAKEVRSLQPPSGGPVRACAEIETATGRFTVEKTWLARKSARVTEAASGRIVAQDDEAEAWIRALVQGGLGGPAGLLWVRQGLTGLTPEGKSEQARQLETRRDLMSSIAGEIDAMTGGRRMDRVLAAAGAALEGLATATGRPRQHGPWKEALDEAADLTGHEADLDRKVRDLAQALQDRRQAEAELARWEAPEARTERQEALARARRDHDAAERHAATRADAETALRIAGLERDKAQRALAEEDSRAAALAEAEAEMETRQAATGAAAQAREAALTAERDCAAALAARGEALAGLRHRLQAAQRAAARAAASREAADLTQRLDQAETHARALDQANRIVAASVVTTGAVDRMAEATEHRDRLRARAEAQAVRVRLRYSGAARASRDGAEIPGDTDLTVPDRATLALPGLGEIEIAAGEGTAASTASDLDRAEAALRALLDPPGLPDLAAARTALAHRQEAEAAARLARELLASVAPEGVEALRTDLTALKDRAEARAAPDDDPSGDPDTLEGRLGPAEAAEARARAAHDRARTALAAAENALVEARTGATLARNALDRIRQDAGTDADRATRRAGAETALARSEEGYRAARARCAALAADAPDIDSARAALARAESVLRAADKATRDLSDRLLSLNERIAARAEDGVEEALSETRGRLAEAQDRAARYETEARALIRLCDALNTARHAARDTYFEPVRSELLPLLAMLHDDADLHLDDGSLLPEALSRGGTTEALETLSGGTAEQLAILTRLAFARLFARTGKRVPIILDDALVFSDDDRIERMFTALHRVAADQQIIVFTCRQRAFSQLGGEIARIEVAETGDTGA